ncbi:MAG TPA: hypothetical protein VM369_01340 [Candidatus Binatia bacterium]|nr:hypothetical protein [Candidatus Binatia bacterium]
MRPLLVLFLVLAAAPAWARHRDPGPPPGPIGFRAWLGAGTGVVVGHVDVPCAPPSTADDCGEDGIFRTYAANLTVALGNGATFRARGLRAEDHDSRHRPWEEAALIGTRLGRGNWYGLIGVGRALHPDDDFVGEAHGFAWEFLFAPATDGPIGFELSFDGHNGEDLDFFAFNLGLRFGLLR